MPSLQCPVTGCVWKSQDLDQEFAAALAISLETHIAFTHKTPSAAVKAEKLDRPTIVKGCSSEDWGYFLSSWTSYKTATKLSDVDTRLQLLACCDGDLRKDLYRSRNDLESKTSVEIIAAIKQLAVRQENVMVSRLALHNMSQDRGEGIRNFEARLRGQADICKFMVKCTCNTPTEVNYTDNMIRDVLVRGLYDQDIQNDILGHENQNMDLEPMLCLIEAKEAGRRSVASLTTEGAHAMSQYRQAQSTAPRSPQKSEVDKKYKCEKCQRPGTRPVGRNGKIRPFKLCRACFAANRSSKGERGEVIGSVTDIICSAVLTCKPIKLQHHVFSTTSGWQQRRSKPQPSINIHAHVCAEDYIHFGAVIQKVPRGGPITAIADIGCQSCLIGMKSIQSQKKTFVTSGTQYKGCKQISYYHHWCSSSSFVRC